MKICMVCGAKLTDRNTSRLCKVHYDQMSARKRYQMLNDTGHRRAVAYQAGPHGENMIIPPLAGVGVRPGGVAVSEPMFVWDGKGRSLTW